MSFDDLAWLFRCDMSNRHLIRMDFDEAALLWKAVARTAGPILEIGRLHGGSTVLLAAAAGPDRQIVSVDRTDRVHPQCADFLASRRDRVELVVADSRSVELSQRFGFCLIDGDHSYTGVLSDTRRFWPIIEPYSGTAPLIFYHDAVPCPRGGRSSHRDGVRRVTDALVAVGAAVVEGVAGSALLLRKQAELPSRFPDR